MNQESFLFSSPVVLFLHKIKGLYVIRLGFVTETAEDVLRYAALPHGPSLV